MQNFETMACWLKKWLGGVFKGLPGAICLCRLRTRFPKQPQTTMQTNDGTATIESRPSSRPRLPLPLPVPQIKSNSCHDRRGDKGQGAGGEIHQEATYKQTTKRRANKHRVRDSDRTSYLICRAQDLIPLQRAGNRA